MKEPSRNWFGLIASLLVILAIAYNVLSYAISSPEPKPGRVSQEKISFSILATAKADSAPLPPGVGVPITVVRLNWSGDFHSGQVVYQTALPVEPTWSNDPAYFNNPAFPIQNPDNQLALGTHYDANSQPDMILLHVPYGMNFTCNYSGVQNAIFPPDKGEFELWAAANPNATFSLDPYQTATTGGWFGQIVNGQYRPYTTANPPTPSFQDLSGIGCLVGTSQASFIHLEATWSGVTTPPANRTEPPATVTILLYAIAGGQ